MPARIRFASILCGALMLGGCTSSEPPAPTPATLTETADLVLTNGWVYTVDANRRVAEAVAIRGNRIMAVGDAADMAPLTGPRTQVRDLRGRMVMPGLHDTHVHALGTVQPDVCDLGSEPRTLDELVTFLRGCIAKYTSAPGEWMIVQQWPYAQGNQPSATHPTLRAALDAASTRHPILLIGDDGHHGAANSAALAQARDRAGNIVGMTAATLAGEFAEWREHVAVDRRGEPSGGVNEGARMVLYPDLFSAFLGAAGKPENVMPRVAAVLASRGITSIQDPATDPEELASYRWLEQQGGMTFRMRAALYLRPRDALADDADQQVPALIAAFSRARSELADSRLIRADGVKLFADGVLEGNPLSHPPTLPIAAVLGHFQQPVFKVSDADHTLGIAGYVDLDGPLCTEVRTHPDRFQDPSGVAAFERTHGYLPSQCQKASGVLENSEAFTHAFVREATAAGFNVHIHAISDRGTRVAVDALEASKPVADRLGLTQSLAHLQLVHPADQKRIGQLGIYTAFTYVWMVPEPGYNLTVIPFIEKVKDVASMFDLSSYYMQNVYPVKAIVDAGGIPTWGSDAPVESRDPRPFMNLEQAVTRAWDDKVLNAANAIDIHTALAAFTINGARMLGIADQTGSIETGKLADLIVLDRNPVELADQGRATEISETQVLLTLFDGRVVHERPER